MCPEQELNPATCWLMGRCSDRAVGYSSVDAPTCDTGLHPSDNLSSLWGTQLPVPPPILWWAEASYSVIKHLVILVHKALMTVNVHGREEEALFFIKNSSSLVSPNNLNFSRRIAPEARVVLGLCLGRPSKIQEKNRIFQNKELCEWRASVLTVGTI